jgi:hypothetical protein
LDLLNKAHNKRLDDQRGLIDANSLEIPEFLLSSNSTLGFNENTKNISSSSASSSPLNINNNKILTRVTNISRSRSPIIFLNDELDEVEVEKKSKYSIYNDLIVVDKKLEENCNYDDSSQVSYV